MKLSFELSRTGKDLKQVVIQPAHADKIRKAQNGNTRIPGGHSYRMYDAAVTTSLNGDFPMSIASANAEVLVSISASRARARKLVRDNPYGWGIENNYCNNVGGEEPFRLEMRVGKYQDGKFVEDVETNREIEEAWREAGKPENCCSSRNLSRLELYHMVIASVIRDGGVLARHRRAYPKNVFNYAIEPIEIDRLDHFYNKPYGVNGNEIQFSIEMDEWHAPIAYWILTRHPGDIFAYSNNPRYRERVDAKDVVPVFDLRKRAGQYVGISRFAPITQRLHRLDQYDVAEMTAAITAAIRIGFFTKTNTSDDYVGDEETEDGLKISRMEQGVNFEELPDNYDIKNFSPEHPVEAYPNFVRQNLCAVGQGVGLAASTIGGDYSNMSFSTGRLEKLPERDSFKVLQEHIKKSFVHPHFNEWLKYAILSGQVKLPISRLEEFQRAAMFHAKRWPYINPLQDAQSDIIRIEAGLDSRSRVIAESERGGDVEQIDSEQASDKACDEAHGLDFTNDPTQPALAKGPIQNAAEGGEATPPAKTGGKQTLKKSRLNGWRHARPFSYDR